MFQANLKPESNYNKINKNTLNNLLRGYEIRVAIHRVPSTNGYNNTSSIHYLLCLSCLRAFQGREKLSMCSQYKGFLILIGPRDAIYYNKKQHQS